MDLQFSDIKLLTGQIGDSPSPNFVFEGIHAVAKMDVG